MKKKTNELKCRNKTKKQEKIYSITKWKNTFLYLINSQEFLVDGKKLFLPFCECYRSMLFFSFTMLQEQEEEEKQAAKKSLFFPVCDHTKYH